MSAFDDTMIDLLEQLLEGRLSDEDRARLERRVLQSPANRRLYVEYLALHGNLYWDAAYGAETADVLLAAMTHVPEPVHSSRPVLSSDPAPLPASFSRFGIRSLSSTRKTLMGAMSLAAAACVMVALWLGLGPDQGIGPQVVQNPAARNPTDKHAPTPQSVSGDQSVAVSQPIIASTVPETRAAPETMVIPKTVAVPETVASRPSLPIAPAPGFGGSFADAPLRAMEMASADTIPVSPVEPPGTAANEIDQPSATPPDAPRQAPIPATVAMMPDGAEGSRNLAGVINHYISAAWSEHGVTASPPAEEADWHRRAYLDLVGHIPTAAETEAYLADKAPSRRERLVDRLVDEPDFARHMATLWTNLLVGRQVRAEYDREALHKFLRVSFAGNRGWDRISSELIAANGRSDESGATNFLLAHINNEAVPATAITARLLLGSQVQCTQCHNHPFNDSRQTAFWELNSFFQQAAGEPVYTIDRKTGERRVIAQRLVDEPVGGPIFYETRTGLMMAAFPRFAGHEIDPGPNVTRREALANLLVADDRHQLAKAFVNRTWSQFFGYGFTRPVDDMGPHNPASHPELLDELAARFVASRYDVKDLVRALCTSEPYQLSSRFVADNRIDDPNRGETPLFSRMYPRSLNVEQLYDSMQVAAGTLHGGQADRSAMEAQRTEWMSGFVVAMETEENDEINTFDGTIGQALSMMNGDLMQQALNHVGPMLKRKAVRRPLTDVEAIQTLSMTALSRPVTDRELATFRKAVQSQRSPDDKLAAWQDVFWAMLNSNEFTIIH